MSNGGKEVGFHEQALIPIMRGEANMAVGADPYFEVPLFSRITRTLWTGCSPAEFPDELEEFGYSVRHFTLPPIRCHWLMHDDKPAFDAILNLYQWGEYVVPEGVDYRVVEMYDSDGLPDKEQVDELAHWVIDRRSMGSTGRVFVHCQAGLNRSSMVAARVLMLAKGMTADDAIALIRHKRSPMCLCNENFERFLKSLDQ